MRRPGVELPTPAAIYVVQSCRMLEIRSINGELIVRVELTLHRIVGGPRIRAAALKHKHPVADCRTGELAPHIRLWRRTVVCWIRGKDDIPEIVDVMDFGSPEIGRIRLIRRRIEEKL